MMKNDLVKRFGVDQNKAVVIYPEVNLSKFKVDNPSRVRQEWREKFNFKNDDFVIGLVTSGNFKKRNLGLLIKSFVEFRKTHPKAKLFIAGGNIDQKYK
jgi:UDP-glucose:(heptosyl)LPS alpha-1,3-glucosyltransferase